MKLADIAKLAQDATGATPIGLAAEAVSQLARIANGIEKIAAHMTRDDKNAQRAERHEERRAAREAKKAERAETKAATPAKEHTAHTTKKESNDNG